jgi:hypothetical protein
MARKTNKKSLTKTYGFAVIAIRRLFSQYFIDDVAIAVLSSELWLPNRTSGVKHQLCWGVFASIKGSGLLK